MAATAEERQLEKITKEFTTAVGALHKKDFARARELFESIGKSYQDSEYYSVLEIQARAQVYANVVALKLQKKSGKPANDEAVILEATAALNGGDAAGALESLEQLTAGKKKSSPYAYYLMSLAQVRLEKEDEALESLKTCLKMDESFKVTAFNEPDFDTLRETEEFLNLVN